MIFSFLTLRLISKISCSKIFRNAENKKFPIVVPNKRCAFDVLRSRILQGLPSIEAIGE